ncbi:MAG: GNAT family N-acetyltransferase [Ahrensia sp.]
MKNLICRRAVGADDLAVCLAIRHAVFIVGQNVPAELERDGRDEACMHYLALVDDEPVGTARIMPLEGKFKFQRVAVLEDFRGRGAGDGLMRFMMNDLSTRPDAVDRQFFLSSQVSAIGFYEKLGFRVCSDVFMDAGIEHRDMCRPVQAT